MSSRIIVKLDTFEGPFDLLLALIHKHEIDIYDIPVAQLAGQYIEAINELPGDMEQISQFVLLAATLLEIKSRMLLPKPTASGEAEEDPREELVQKLEEYRYFKEISHILRDRGWFGENQVYKKPDAAFGENDRMRVSSEETSNLLQNVTLELMLEIFSGVLSRGMRKEHIGFTDIKKDSYRVEDKVGYLIAELNRVGGFNFFDVFNVCRCREEQVCTFLALLEIIRAGRALIVQDKSFGEIYCERV